MSLRSIAFCLGLFSVVVGLLTYDREVVTASVPVVTGLIVVVLALADFIPEFKICRFCQNKIFKKASKCRHCGADQADTTEVK